MFQKTMTRTAAAILAAAMTFGLAAGAQAGERLDAVNAKKVLRVGTPADYRPFAMVENDAYVGHDIELIRAMAETAGWKVEFVRTPWKDLKAGIEGNKFDVAVGGITQTVERTGWGVFLPGYAPFGKVALVAAGTSDRYKVPEDLNKPSVRVIKNPGGTNEKYVLEHMQKAQISTHEKNYEIPGLIAEGKGDVMITETAEAKIYLKKFTGKLEAVFMDDPLTPVSEMGFWMPKDDADFIRVMEQLWHLTDIRGTQEALEEKWLD